MPEDAIKRITPPYSVKSRVWGIGVTMLYKTYDVAEAEKLEKEHGVVCDHRLERIAGSPVRSVYTFDLPEKEIASVQSETKKVEEIKEPPKKRGNPNWGKK